MAKRGVIKKPYYLDTIDVIPNRCINLLVAIEMRRLKFTFQEIGDYFHVSKQAARNLIRKYELIICKVPLKDRKHKKRKDARQSSPS